MFSLRALTLHPPLLQSCKQTRTCQCMYACVCGMCVCVCARARVCAGRRASECTCAPIVQERLEMVKVDTT